VGESRLASRAGSVLKLMPLRSVLLFSGGLDSTALAALERPELCLFVDYGQRPAIGEARAAERIASSLGLNFETIHLGIGHLGSGLLFGEAIDSKSPSPEWWPFRNQFLVTAAAACALRKSFEAVIVGSVLSDGLRHVDGSVTFYSALDRLTSMQEGGIRVLTPGIGETTQSLVGRSCLQSEILNWTFSCHRSEVACNVCPGCIKRLEVLTELGHRKW
jgi:7-cyano-7-deazaguanine synthase